MCYKKVYIENSYVIKIVQLTILKLIISDDFKILLQLRWFS